MKNITINHLIASNRLYAEPDKDIAETLKPLAILRLDAEAQREVGLITLKTLTGEGNLQITTSDGKKFNSKGRTYFIAQPVGTELVVQEWNMGGTESLQYLKDALTTGKMLVCADKTITTNQQKGYRVLLTQKDAGGLAITHDKQGLWHEICHAYANSVMRGLVHWETPPSADRVIKNILDSDAALAMVKHEGLDLREFFMAEMDEQLSELNELVTAFVEQDAWAFYHVGVDARGVFISRHRDARAIIWNREMIEERDNKELEA